MTEKESVKALHDAFTAFPGVQSWVKANSPDEEGTLRIWAKSLEPFTKSEVESVIARWSNGTLPAPTGYEKENFHLHIRAVVMNDRSKAHRESTRETVLKQHRRTSVFDSMPILGPYMAKLMRVKNDCDMGLISVEERDRRIEALKDEAMAQVDNQRSVI